MPSAGGGTRRTAVPWAGHTGTETIKTHVSLALAELGARDRTQAVITADESGCVTPPAERLRHGRSRAAHGVLRTAGAWPACRPEQGRLRNVRYRVIRRSAWAGCQ
ncbi:hypothetical protein GCM10010341_65830 [Streptomyces noursei]|nr:hypothetical protein GCM10010341_65830 [Streptomyces noursei]